MNKNDCKEALALIIFGFIVLIFSECIAVSRYGSLSAFFDKNTELVIGLGIISLFTVVPAACAIVASIVEGLIDEYKNK